MKATTTQNIRWGKDRTIKYGALCEVSDVVYGKHATLTFTEDHYELKLFKVQLCMFDAGKTFPAVPASFTFDDGVVHAGYHRGDEWNGWACPFFDKETAEAVCKSVTENDAGEWKYNQETDAFSILFNDTRCDEEDDCWDHFEGVDVLVVGGEIKHLYSIGGWSWVWDIVGDDDE